LAKADHEVEKYRVRTEKLCKICQHEHRLDIERMLIQSSDRERDEDGNRVTWRYIIEVAKNKFGLRLTHDNISRHTKKHLGYHEAKETMVRNLEREVEVEAQLGVLQAGLDRVTGHQIQEAIKAFGMKNITESDGATITPDHMIQILKLEQQGKQGDSVNSLVDAAAKAVNVSLNALTGGQDPQKVEADFEVEPTEESEGDE